jgi:hypothetical protein
MPETAELTLEQARKLPEPAAHKEVEETPFAQAVLKHWQEFRPKMCAEMEKAKVLYRLVLVAAFLTVELRVSLTQQGLSWEKVVELADHQWYRLPEEEEQPNLELTPSNLGLSMETSA